jgi:hypothetical protein
MFIFGLEASLTTDRVPCALPVAVGTKSTEIVVAWFGVSVTAAPLFTLKFAPAIEIEEIETLEGPASVRTTDCVAGEPTATPPKLTLLELGEREEAASSPLDEPPPPPPRGLPTRPQPVVASKASETAAAYHAAAKRRTAFLLRPSDRLSDSG